MRSHAILGTVLGLCFFSLVSCVSTGLSPSDPHLRLLDKEMIITAFGPSQGKNPYISPASLFTKPAFEFAVVQIVIPKGEADEYSFDAVCLGPDGSVVGELISFEDLVELWKLFPDSDTNLAKRDDILSRTYIPGFSFQVRNGQKYYAIVEGKYPFPRPARLVATLISKRGVKIRFEEELAVEPYF